MCVCVCVCMCVCVCVRVRVHGHMRVHVHVRVWDQLLRPTSHPTHTLCPHSPSHLCAAPKISDMCVWFLNPHALPLPRPQAACWRD